MWTPLRKVESRGHGRLHAVALEVRDGGPEGVQHARDRRIRDVRFLHGELEAGRRVIGALPEAQCTSQYTCTELGRGTEGGG